MPGAVVFGIVAGTEQAPDVAWLERPVPVTPELLATTDGVDPERVFRVAAPCQEGGCVHWSGSKCKLVKRIVTLLTAGNELPPCHLRSECRWYGQEGKEACRRCPQVITHAYDPPAEIAEAATPA